MDIIKIEEIVSEIVAAAPAIEQGVVTIAPYVQAIVTMIENGGAPTDDQWAALKASLDAGTQELDVAAEVAQQELDQEGKD